MHLKSIQIQNFRCFEDLKVDFEDDLTVFVAMNGGGKTTLMNAIAAAFETCSNSSSRIISSTRPPRCSNPSRNGAKAKSPNSSVPRWKSPTVAGKTAIDLPGLNCPRLRDARAEVLHHIERTINVARRKAGANPGATVRYLLERYLRQDQNGRWGRFFTLIRWRLRDPVEAHLREIGFDG